MQANTDKRLWTGWRAALMATAVALVLILAPGTSLAAAQKGLVDINAASQAELEAVKGVGPATAKKIIAHRPYKSLEDLSKAGLSAKKIDSLKSFLTVKETAAPGAPATAKETKKQVETAPAAKVKEPKAATPPAGGPIDLNTADQKALEDLPGVGPVMAKKIMAARPFKSVADLSKIKGMSKAKVAALKDKVTVGPVKAPTPAAKPAPAAPPPAAPAPPAPAAEKPATVKEPTPAAKPAETAKEKGPPTKLAPGQKVNLNTATKAELEKLPDIGPVKAQAIIDGRPYKKIEDVMKVKGIKEGIFNKIKNHLTVD